MPLQENRRRVPAATLLAEIRPGGGHKGFYYKKQNCVFGCRQFAGGEVSYVVNSSAE
jgi:hypothetical protein